MAWVGGRGQRSAAANRGVLSLAESTVRNVELKLEIGRASESLKSWLVRGLGQLMQHVRFPALARDCKILIELSFVPG